MSMTPPRRGGDRQRERAAGERRGGAVNMNNDTSIRKRLEARVDKSDPAGCWLWTGALSDTGYGSIGTGKKTQMTHRVAWQLENGPIPGGLWVLHRCDNRRCVRPDHLFLGTTQDNTRDKLLKGRQPTGSRVAGSKLNEAQVLAVVEMRNRGVQHKDIAAHFGISKANVNHIVTGDSWAWLTGIPSKAKRRLA